MKVLVICDGSSSAGTYNMKGIANKSKHELRVINFRGKQGDYDWADLIYIHYGGIGEWSGLLDDLKTVRNKPWVGGVRGYGNFKKCFSGKGLRSWNPVWFVEKWNAISCSNRQLQNMVKEATDIPAYVCGAGVDTSRFVPTDPPKEFNIGWVGNPWTGAKRVNRLQIFPFKLNLVGAFKDYIEEKYNPNDWISKPNFHQYIPYDQLHLFYQSISVYVSVADNEGCPMPPLESAASGRPVVATEAGSALVDWIPKEYLVPTNEPEKMIPIIERLRNDKDLYLRECTRFREISLKWDFSEIAKQYNRMFSEVYESFITAH